ncbi:MAG: hypothetical protein HKN23_00635 [Verrucomicrobiales bacterium]|nr:hypothetical protein [Verrucomicrobiales bacterium]
MPVLQLQYQGKDLDCSINKVDRSKLYGYKTTEVLDEEGNKCNLATLSSDGKTLIPSGGVALGYVSPKGLWREKSDLKAVDLDGKEIEPVTSTFKNRVDLTDKATVEEFFDHNIRMSYALEPTTEEGEATFPPELVKDLAAGTIYRFPFSYRGGMTADTAFLLQDSDNTIWMLVGKKADIRLISYEQQGAATVEVEDEAGDDDEDLDFGMM